jgi:hypothetical protein
MTVGLPGAGIGGIFYLASALLMPFREAIRLCRGDRAERGRMVVMQTAIAAGILGALWATGWMLGHMIASASQVSSLHGRVPTIGAGLNIVRVSALLVGFGTLALVLASVQVARIVVKVTALRERRRLEGKEAAASSKIGELRVDSGTFGRVR